jgi:hypothetical protein
MDRNEFFAILDQLTPSQIEARLPLWDHDQLKWLGEYLERRDGNAAKTGQGARPVTEAVAAVAAMASRASKIATVSLIIAIGAMLAAIVAGLAVYEALQRR